MLPVTQQKNRKLTWRWLSSELKRREVYPVIVAYAVVGWLLLQIGEVTFGPLGLPDWVMIALIVVVVAGFPAPLNSSIASVFLLPTVAQPCPCSWVSLA